MKLSISVMAHESRADNFAYLSRMLGDVPFSIDKGARGTPGNLGEWGNAKRAWMMYDPEAEWHVVIQDDAIICENFRQRAESVILKAKTVLKTEDYVCNFYFGSNRVSRPIGADIVKRGLTYWINAYPKWGVAMCMQTKYIKEMIAFCDKLDEKQHGTRDDSRIAKYIGHKRMKVYFPMPSIIDHRHGPSLVGDPGEKRGAYQFIDNENVK